MAHTTHPSGPEPATLPALSPMQHAYLVGDRAGLELRGPARYYLGCDLDPDLVDGLTDRLRALVRANDILRCTEAPDGLLTVRPPAAADGVDIAVLDTAPDGFDPANAATRSALSADGFGFAGWARFAAVVVRSGLRARLHLVYALWLMDGAALAVFLAELTQPPVPAPPVPPPPVPPAPPAGPTRRRAERDARFWRERAASLADPAELPLRPDWRQAGPAVGHRMLTLDAGRAGRIAAIAARHALTLPMVYLAAYGVTLGRLGGGGPHTVTVLRSRRTGPARADALGNEGTTMPVEIPGPAGLPFAELARVVQGRYLGQAMRAGLNGGEMARLIDPGSRRLPFPLAFTALEADSAGEAGRGLHRRWDEVVLRVPQVLLDHQAVLESDGRVRLGFDWRRDAFDAGFVEDLIDRHAELLTELAELAELAGPAAPAWRSTPDPVATTPGRPLRPSPVDTLPGRVRRAAAATPDAPAVYDEAGRLSYADLLGRADALAHDLLAAGARPGDPVGVHLPRGRGQVIGIVGALLAGCVFVPLDHTTPDGRLDSIAARGDVRFAVTDGRPGVDRRWRDRGARPLPVPTRSAPASSPVAPATATAPVPATAYVIFTSGSTGEPKGVVVSHAAVLSTVDSVNHLLGLGPDDRVLSVSSIGFDLSVYDIFGPLLRGGAVVLLSERSARSPAAWVELIDRHRVTVWNSAPALASLLAGEAAALPSVRSFLLSGDWIPLTLPGALGRLAPAAEVISLGGATEGAIWSIHHRVVPADAARRSIPYGRPLSGQDILVLDRARRDCPDWAIGEICIAGAGVADGYVNDPDRTAAAFSTHPRYGWIYRTGDRGRRWPDGVVEFLGRTDTQVKLSGHRIELGEIENLLERAPGIRRCAACVRELGPGRRIVAYVSLDPAAPANWREGAYVALRQALPRYMVPDTVVELDEIPLTDNGKVDRRRLLTLPTGAAPEPSAAPVATGLAAGEVAVGWQEILGTPPGPDSFFDAGGGSYDAIRLLSLLRARFGYEVAFGDFMAEPTHAGLARLCQRARPGDADVWTFRPRPVAGPRLRLVLFPPVGGGVACYASLVRSLPADVDVYLVGCDAAAPVDDLAGLARRCVARLPATSWSRGVPVVLAGWSFGGALAFEAAGALAPTADVVRVVVVDTPIGPGSRGRAEPSPADFARDIAAATGVVVDPARVLTDPTIRGRYDVYRRNLALLGAWTPRPAPVDVVELRAADHPAEPDPLAWSRFARIEATAELAGGHFSVFDEDNLASVADAVTAVPR